ncbi:ParB/RepB/Spo0J family partition protein [Pseudosulfitobacter pseudonitzschiae]|uniref:Chromosome partitioning protein ParB n=1 Tax=Pseudosulfitobacter pseudonitzschiae TaxID=1402135 RepID=A0A073J5L5_9RHOB|nr:ParB/RepB/Spo0J family partition protein [Pseudosulfitobacter pseudonitzschiae]KEJ97060.1 chromosome partitioning protein ParB [Pseudosulfitobacter pseudonitzschiae]MBM1815616.1 ParB/RepB/Spo0J family partition protein [Pseudosulfitobacter pseudonitzschiae]MBM1832607.1 ParB/RepB/Spo0J family partition protein [Pseudosulfitobacter pseudonitzschiae]MBM1837475.1 ParB/RepB/Spo0J family partition protein [Pseudosulfitobacter pseudonitzschiae]MBM1842321.1 ParB/RepB/Spo0J family partition protein 
MVPKDKKRGLGRGLSALMADVNEAEKATVESVASGVRMVPIEQVKPNPDQPRKRFTQDDLDDLAASISEKGVIQPLIVREKDGGFEIVAGERRWRAAQMAKLHELPVILRDFDDMEVLEVAIIENIQRADLNAIEEAVGYRQLMDKFGHTQEKMAEALGKSRSHIANLLRLLQLPDDVVELVRKGDLSSGHARALITADNPSALARKVVAEGLSVRATEALVKSMQGRGEETAPKSSKRAGETKDADTKALEGDLSAALGMTVQLSHKPGAEAGQMSISYKTLEELDELCRILSGS